MSQMPYPIYPPFGAPVPRGAPGQTDTFLAYMQDGKIFRQTPEGPQAIGVTGKAHDDLQADYDSIYATCQEYYDALVKAGIIVPEPTQEELLKQQAEQLKAQAEQLREASRIIADGGRNQEALAGMIAGLRAEIAALTRGENHADTTEPCAEHVGIVPSVESVDQSGVGDKPQLPELPRRPHAGDSRSEPARAGSAKRAAVSAKRSGSKHP